MSDTLVDVGAARAVDATKAYGEGDAAVHALAGVSDELVSEITFRAQRRTLPTMTIANFTSNRRNQ